MGTCRFNTPQNINQIHLLFDELEMERTQEFLLSWLPAGSESYREIARQQYNFSPQGSVIETENYQVNLSNAAALELKIIPDINRSENIYATLGQLRLV